MFNSPRPEFLNTKNGDSVTRVAARGDLAAFFRVHPRSTRYFTAISVVYRLCVAVAR
jgi:hypothetical protein